MQQLRANDLSAIENLFETPGRPTVSALLIVWFAKPIGSFPYNRTFPEDKVSGDFWVGNCHLT